MHVFLTSVLPYALAVIGYLWHKHTVARQLTKHRKQTALIMNAVNTNLTRLLSSQNTETGHW